MRLLGLRRVVIVVVLRVLLRQLRPWRRLRLLRRWLLSGRGLVLLLRLALRALRCQRLLCLLWYDVWCHGWLLVRAGRVHEWVCMGAVLASRHAAGLVERPVAVVVDYCSLPASRAYTSVRTGRAQGSRS